MTLDVSKKAAAPRMTPWRWAACLLIPLLSFLNIAQVCANTDFSRLQSISQLHPDKNVLLDIIELPNANDLARILAVGEQGIIIYSNDYGKHWLQASVPVSVTLTAVYFSTHQLGWAVGHQGIILHSKDGGQSWEQQFSGVQAHEQIRSIAKKREQTLLAEMANTKDEMAASELKYQMGDIQFLIKDAEKAIADGPSEPLLDVWFKDENFGIAVGAYGLLLVTNNGGEQWKLHDVYLENVDKFHFYSIVQLDDNEIYLCGESGTLWQSRDNGENWQPLDSPYHGSLFGIIKTRKEELIVYGLKGNIFRSADNARSWQKITANSEASFLGAQVTADGAIALVGTSGTLALSSDDGASFESVTMASKSTFSSTLFIDMKNLLMVGINGLEVWSINELGGR